MIFFRDFLFRAIVQFSRKTRIIGVAKTSYNTVNILSWHSFSTYTWLNNYSLNLKGVFIFGRLHSLVCHITNEIKSNWLQIGWWIIKRLGWSSLLTCALTVQANPQTALRGVLLSRVLFTWNTMVTESPSTWVQNRTVEQTRLTTTVLSGTGKTAPLRQHESFIFWIFPEYF